MRGALTGFCRLIAVTVMAGVTLAPGALLAAGASPGVATPIQREQAQARFLRGKELFAKQAFAESLVEFQGSLAIVASPNTRLYAARCYRQMGKLVEAYVELLRTSVEAREHSSEDTRYVKTGEAADQERLDLAPQLGFVSVTVDRAAGNTTLKVGQEEIGRGGWREPIPVMPGTAEVIVETPDRAPLRQEVRLAAGESKALSFDAAADAPSSSVAGTPAMQAPVATSRAGLRPYAYVAGGVGAAGIVTFVVAGLLSKGTYDDLASSCHGPCPRSRQSDIDAGKTQQTVANVGLVVGIVGAAAGVTLFVLSAPAKDKPASAAFVASPTEVGLRGVF